jgi:hypothetical protein
MIVPNNNEVGKLAQSRNEALMVPNVRRCVLAVTLLSSIVSLMLWAGAVYGGDEKSSPQRPSVKGVDRIDEDSPPKKGLQSIKSVAPTDDEEQPPKKPKNSNASKTGAPISPK